MTHSRNSAASASTAETTTTSNFSEKDQHIGKMGLTRRSNGSAAAAAAAAAGDSSTPSPSPRVLQKWHEIPAHLRFNRYVTSHYRPLDDWKGCLRSLFYIHNETVNIFTHGNAMHLLLSPTYVFHAHRLLQLSPSWRSLPPCAPSCPGAPSTSRTCPRCTWWPSSRPGWDPPSTTSS